MRLILALVLLLSSSTLFSYDGKDYFKYADVEKMKNSEFEKYITDDIRKYKDDNGIFSVFQNELYTQLIKNGNSGFLVISIDDIFDNNSNFISASSFVNPLIISIEQKNKTIFDLICKKYPQLINATTKNWKSNSYSPFQAALIYGDLSYFDYLVDKVDIKYENENMLLRDIYAYDEIQIPANLLSITNDKSCQKKLIAIGIKDIFDYKSTIDVICNDNNVNIRAIPGTNGKIIGQLFIDDKALMTGITYYNDLAFVENQQNAYMNRWVRINRKGQIGWVSMKYLKFPTNFLGI
jgi:hypothetical protein